MRAKRYRHTMKLPTRTGRPLLFIGVFTSIATALPLCGCGSSPAQAPNESPPAAQVATESGKAAARPQDELSVADFFVKSTLPPGYEKGKFLKAWRDVQNHDRYRLALAGDFRIPEVIKQANYWQDTERALGRPYMWGEFDGNHGNNLVLVVVDRTKESPDRFGVVLFIERKGRGYDVRWIYRDEDFSSGFTVHRHSGDIYITEFRPDGTQKSCDIEWVRSQRRFACVGY